MVLSWGLASSGHAPAPRFVYSQDRTHRQSDCGPRPRGLRKHRLLSAPHGSPQDMGTEGSWLGHLPSPLHGP